MAEHCRNYHKTKLTPSPSCRRDLLEVCTSVLLQQCCINSKPMAKLPKEVSGTEEATLKETRQVHSLREPQSDPGIWAVLMYLGSNI